MKKQETSAGRYTSGAFALLLSLDIEQTNFPKIYDPPRRSKFQKVHLKQVPLSESTNIMRHCRKYNCHGDMAPGICEHLVVDLRGQW